MRQYTRNRHLRQRGMSLIEIMVVITIMSLVMAAVTVAVWPKLKQASCKTAYASAQKIQGYIVHYRGEHDFECPKSITDLKAQGLKDREINDPWNQPFQFKCPGEHEDEADVWSNGPDKQPNTPDDVRGWVSDKEQCK
jgi:general secretion pathway protein G